jgi:hypothetical protein
MPVHGYDAVARIAAVVIELGYAFLFETYFNASSYSVSAQKLLFVFQRTSINI